ncbi:NAD(P)/FAD-dependent oxidoreductase, partial [Candidatus Gracilibacteria bacterium]|nr:NAD(P)/FAD-dependent oxidoreductase [Candidatus Gracilibacteria bacterium]
MKLITIIGGGAAGLMIAAHILESQTGEEYHIHLYEKNPSLGRKILISGGGRCNVTTGIDD